jgi:hypothetical protein
VNEKTFYLLRFTLICNQQVIGSNPIAGSIIPLILNERAGGRKTASGWEGWAYLLGSGKKG